MQETGDRRKQWQPHSAIVPVVLAARPFIAARLMVESAHPRYVRQARGRRERGAMRAGNGRRAVDGGAGGPGPGPGGARCLILGGSKRTIPIEHRTVLLLRKHRLYWAKGDRAYGDRAYT